MSLQDGEDIFPAAQSLAAFAAPQSLLNRLVAVLYALGSMHDCVLTVIMAEVRVVVREQSSASACLDVFFHRCYSLHH